MTNEELRIVLTYCWKLSRLVTPRDAKADGLQNFDSSVCDFLNDLSLCNDVKDFNVKTDDFYAPVFQDMSKSVSSRNIG